MEPDVGDVVPQPPPCTALDCHASGHCQGVMVETPGEMCHHVGSNLILSLFLWRIWRTIIGKTHKLSSQHSVLSNIKHTTKDVTKQKLVTIPICRSMWKMRLFASASYNFDCTSLSTPSTTPDLPLIPTTVLHKQHTYLLQTGF